MAHEWKAVVYENGVAVARCYGPTRKDVESEAFHYGAMYARDGGVVKVKIIQPKAKQGERV